MAKKKPPTSTTPAIDMALLGTIVSATQANAFIFTVPAAHAPLIAAGLVEVNDGMVDPSGTGGLATRATPQGIALAGKGPGAAVGGVGAAPKPTATAFALDVGVPMPPAKPRGAFGGGARPEIYPFSKMEVGQSFFLAATAEKPEPETSFASTVSSATRRYDEVVLDASGAPVMEEKMVAVPGPDGKIQKDGAGKVIREKRSVQKMRHTRVFTIRAVDETAQGRGKGARIWRVS